MFSTLTINKSKLNKNKIFLTSSIHHFHRLKIIVLFDDLAGLTFGFCVLKYFTTLKTKWPCPYDDEILALMKDIFHILACRVQQCQGHLQQ